MDKVHMFNTLLQLQVELTKRLDDEVASANNPEKVSEYKRQLIQIQTELDRINRGSSYKRH